MADVENFPDFLFYDQNSSFVFPVDLDDFFKVFALD